MTLEDILLQMQGQTPARMRTAAPGMFAPPGDSPIAALLQSLAHVPAMPPLGGGPIGAPPVLNGPPIALPIPAPAGPSASPAITSSPLMGAWLAAQQPAGPGMFAPAPQVDTNRLFEVLTSGNPQAPVSPLAAGVGVQPAAPVPRVSAPSAPPQVSGQPSPGTIKWGLPAAPAATASPRSFTIGGGGQSAAPDPKVAAMQTIRGFEGFREKPYWDVNADRVGYGSDTVTLADGTIKPVTKGMTVTREDAERDLSRRTDEFMQKAQSQVGETFSKFAPNQIAALTSIAYNYGELPASVATAAKSGDPEAVAKAIEGLKGHNNGVNADRRQKEANLFRGSDMSALSGGNPMPGVPNISAPQLPIPSATVPLQGLPPNAFDAFNALKVSRPPPMETADRITNVLAQMAAGAMGGRDVGSTILGAGAGAAAGASQNIRSERKEAWDVSEKEDALKKLLAGISVQKAEAETAAQNLKIRAKNEDNTLLNQVKTEQAKLDQAAKNKVAEIQNDVDWKRWQMFEPQIKADKDGVTIIRRQQDGSMKVEMQKGNEMDALADRIKDAGAIFGKDSQTVDTLRYTALARQGEPYLRRQIMRDMIDKNMAVDVLGKEGFDKLNKEAEKGLDQTLRGKPEEWDAQKKQRMIDLLWAMKMPDEAWLPKMLQKGNLGAMLLAQPGG